MSLIRFSAVRLTSLAWVAALALVAAACGSSSTTSSGPTPVKCQVSLSLPLSTVDATGGTATLNVSTSAECAWSAASSVSWISGLTPASGQGQGQVQFQVAPNPGPSPRQGDITLNGVTARLSQMGVGCRIELDPRSRSFEAGAATGTVAVTTAAGCPWTATSNDPWLAVTAGGSGSANGTVTYSVASNSGAARAGTISIGDQTFVVTQSSPTAALCQYSVAPTSTSIGAGGGTTGVAIQTDASCSWAAASNVAWLAIVGVGTGSGNGNVTVSAQANTGPARAGTLTIAGQTFTVNQAGSCASAINPTSTSIAVGGGTGQVGVTTAAGCAWTSSSNASWLTVTAGASGSGSGQVSFSAAANPAGPRSGTLTIAGQTFTVNQAGSCAASINPTSFGAPATAGTGPQISVTAAAGCAWTATSNAAWLSVTAGSSGSGNGTVAFTFAANTGAARAGTLTIAGQTFTVNQAGGCASSINPTSQSIGAAGGAGTQIAVTSTAGCAWTATTSDTWITITSGATGSGNGTVNFTIAANSGPSRIGTISVAGQTFTVNQAAGCAASINPTSQTVGAAGGTATSVAVTSTAGCAWTATSNASWITITQGASGSGNGSVTFTVAATTGPERTGTLTIAGQTHTVTQTSGCTYSINPTSHNLSDAAQTSPAISVTAGAGCTWTAVSNAGFITITEGASGTGNGTVRYSVTKNNGNNSRTGTITIAGRTFTVNQAEDD